MNVFQFATLNHWRGFACLSVLIFHSFGPLPQDRSTLHPSLAPLAYLASFGWFGVHLFFVISGYCVAVKAYSTVDQGRRSVPFIADRLFRIYPTYWAASLISIFLALVFAPLSRGQIADSLPDGLSGFLANLFLVEPYFGQEPLLLVSWSLVYELAFYVLMAIGIGVKSYIHSWIPVVVIGVLLALAGIAGAHQFTPLMALRFWPEFFCGVVVFLFVHSHQRYGPRAFMWMLLPLSLSIASLFVSGFNSATTLPWAGLFSLLLMCQHRFDTRIASLKALSWLAWTGTISFSLYLIHLPITNRVMNGGLRLFDPSSWTIWILLVSAWITGILLSSVFFYLIEMRFERWRHGCFNRKLKSSFP